MFFDVRYMEKGVAYQICNRKTKTYLTSGNEVTTSPLQRGKISQYWLFD